MNDLNRQIDALVHRVEYQIGENNRVLAEVTAGVKPLPQVEGLYQYHER